MLKDRVLKFSVVMNLAIYMCNKAGKKIRHFRSKPEVKQIFRKNEFSDQIKNEYVFCRAYLTESNTESCFKIGRRIAEISGFKI